MELDQQQQPGSSSTVSGSTPPLQISPHGSPSLQQSQRLGKHLSKSASELNGHDCHLSESPHISPKRAKSAVAQQLAGVSSGAWPAAWACCRRRTDSSTIFDIAGVARRAKIVWVASRPVIFSKKAPTMRRIIVPKAVP